MSKFYEIEPTYENYWRSIILFGRNVASYIEQTIKRGFVNVIDAFHIVHQQELSCRFFEDARKTQGGIILTDEFYQLAVTDQASDLLNEVESRWRLVETAWDMNLPKQLVQIEHDEKGFLIANNKLRRINVTSAKMALNGYQKGRCFYCFKEILQKDAEVDHFFPHKLRYCDAKKPINGVANLVLACQACNRLENGKFDRLPSLFLLERLHQRNEYLITSHHPLRETLIAQTGFTAQKRQAFIQSAYNCAIRTLGANSKWQPLQQGLAIF